jgi:ammonia channel protein AmtB
VFSLVTVLWCIYGYSLAFTEGNAFVGGFDRLFLKGAIVDGFMSPVAAAERPFASGLTGATTSSARCVILGRLAQPIRCIRTSSGPSASNVSP